MQRLTHVLNYVSLARVFPSKTVEGHERARAKTLPSACFARMFRPRWGASDTYSPPRFHHSMPYVTTPDALKWGIRECRADRCHPGATSRWCTIDDGSDTVCRAWQTHRCVSASVGGVTAGNGKNRWADSAGPLFGVGLFVVDGLRWDGGGRGEWRGAEHLGRARAVDDDDLQSGE
jgi:hypothetical protein